MGTVVVGAFEDEAVADISNTEGEPLLIMPVGEVPDEENSLITTLSFMGTTMGTYAGDGGMVLFF